jgi:predicted AAA+ superfamily ATPase
MWIKRDLSHYLNINYEPIQILRGPRQCGKTSLILHLDSEFEEVSLDDPSFRALAQKDPEVFLDQFKGKRLFIDEAQYAPQLFPSLKRRVDLYKRAQLAGATAHLPTTHLKVPLFRLTGSNQILMDRQVKESLAGRASFFDLNTLSVSEILASQERAIQEILYMGGWPDLYAEPNASMRKDTRKYLDDYINSYIEKDVVLAAGIAKQNEFLNLVRLLAGRVGQILDLASFSRDAGVDSKTVKEWISVLERMGIVALVRPFSTNLSSRLIKSPKLYFIDSGLACRLQGWTSAQPILTSPQQGALFENLVFSEIYKTILNHQLGWEIFHWRSRDQEEIDFLIQIAPQKFLFVDAKVSAQSPASFNHYPEVKKVFKNQPPQYIHCHMSGDRIFNQNVPIAMMQEFLLAHRK